MIGWFRPGVGNEGQNIGGGDERGHAEKADELGLDGRRHDQSGDICQGRDTRDSEEDVLAKFRMELSYRIEESLLYTPRCGRHLRLLALR